MAQDESETVSAHHGVARPDNWVTSQHGVLVARSRQGEDYRTCPSVRLRTRHRPRRSGSSSFSPPKPEPKTGLASVAATPSSPSVIHTGIALRVSIGENPVIYGRENPRGWTHRGNEPGQAPRLQGHQPACCRHAEDGSAAVDASPSRERALVGVSVQLSTAALLMAEALLLVLLPDFTGHIESDSTDRVRWSGHSYQRSSWYSPHGSK